MTKIVRSIQRYEDKVDNRAEKLIFFHPYLSLLTMFIGIPGFILMTVTAATTLFTLPMTWMFGWA